MFGAVSIHYRGKIIVCSQCLPFTLNEQVQVFRRVVRDNIALRTRWIHGDRRGRVVALARVERLALQPSPQSSGRSCHG